jgi:hypothetical protein
MFISSHGLSFDWICGGDVSSMICMLASSSQRAKEAPDPIHEAIEDHKRAYIAFDDCITRQSKLEKLLPNHLRQSSIDCEGIKIVETDDPRWIAVEQEWQRLSDVEEEAAMALINIEPTTLGGAAHLMRYVVEHEARGNTWPDGLLDDDAPPTAIGKPWSFYLHKNLAVLLEASAAIAA